MPPEQKIDTQALIQQYQPDFCVAYGSGVFQQAGCNQNENPMVDLIFAVDDPASWHEHNLIEHPTDYSRLIQVFSGTPLSLFLISLFQEALPNIFYNVGIPFGDGNARIKYGIIPKKALEEDLTQWTTLYMAGRLQKPVLHIVDDPRISEAMQENLRHAVNVAILLCANKVTDEDFFKTIANISYHGDWRMRVAGDHPRKAQNIVSNNLQGFCDLYKQAIIDCGIDSSPIPDADDLFTTHKTVRIEQIVSELPENLRQRLSSDIHTKPDEQIQQELINGIKQISRGPSLNVSLRELVTYGFFPSMGYALRKLGKGIKGRYLEKK